MLTVRDLLRGKGDGIWAISPETSTLDALRFMTEKNVGALIVLEDGILSGIVSERDFVHRITDDRDCQLSTPIKEYMTTKLVTVKPASTIEECMKLMTDKRIRHLPVLNDKDELIGIISIGDVVKGIIDEQVMTIHNLEDYILGTGYSR